MRNMENQLKYKIHDIAYTEIGGKRAKENVSAESSEEALALLEEALLNFNYSHKDLENLIPLVKITRDTSNKTWVNFQ